VFGHTEGDVTMDFDQLVADRVGHLMGILFTRVDDPEPWRPQIERNVTAHFQLKAMRPEVSPDLGDPDESYIDGAGNLAYESDAELLTDDSGNPITDETPLPTV
jgi:hypothetical protein